MNGGGQPPGAASDRVLTVPNLISLSRILLTPVFVALLIDPDTTTAGLIVFAVVVATDWIDGAVARRTGQVSEVGKVLDPLADRLAIAAGLIALMVRGVFPVWAGLILFRDLAVVIGVALLSSRGIRLEVRWIGKLATFSLMTAIVAVSWGNLGLPLSEGALVVGWASYAVGIIEYYVSAWVYATDLRRATRAARPG